MDSALRNRLLGLVFLSQTFSFAATLLPSLLSEGGRLSAIQAGFVISLSCLVSGFCQPMMGNWLDRGRVLWAFWVVFAGYSVGIGAFLLPASQHAFTVLGSLFLVIGHATLRTMMSTAIVARFKGEERAKAATARYFVSNAALAVAAVIAMNFFESFRTELLVLDWLTTLIMAIGISYRLRKDSQLQSTAAHVPFSESMAVLKEAFRRHGRRIFGLNLITLGFSAHFTYLPLLFAKRGESGVSVNAICLLINTVIIVLCLRAVQKFTKNWGERRVGLVSAALIGFGMCVTPFAGNNWLLYAGIAVWTLGELIYLPWEQVQLLNCFPDEQPGLASGAISFLMSAVFVLAPILASLLLACPNGIASALLLLLPFAGYAMFHEGTKKKIEEDELRLAS